MSEINDNIETPTNAFEHFKNIFKMLRLKQYKDSIREVWAFIKAVFILLKRLYVKYLKGQYVVVKGKRIPRTALAILCVFLLYLISPMSCVFDTSSEAEETEVAQADPNTYNKDGLKVYEMRKCDIAACGILEYRGQQDIEKLRISVTFFNPAGQPIYEGSAEALQLAPNSRMEFTIPCDEDFGYFKLKDVEINPTDEPQEDQEPQAE